MGVSNLWQLLTPAGKRVTLESLGNKTLAIDLSIWLHQFIKAIRDDDESHSPNGYLRGLFFRICKLLFFGIKPVFVFDGATPQLKFRTIEERNKRRERLIGSATDAQRRLILLNALSKAKAKKRSQTSNTNDDQKPSVPNEIIDVENENDAAIAAILVEDEFESSLNDEDGDFEEIRFYGGDDDSDVEDITLTKDVKFETPQEVKPKPSIVSNFVFSDSVVKKLMIDFEIDERVFKELPPDVQFEQLQALKYKNMKKSREKLVADEHTPTSFSDSQLQKLLAIGKVNRKIDELKSKMSSNRAPIASDANAEYVLAKVTRIDDSLPMGETGADSGSGFFIDNEDVSVLREDRSNERPVVKTEVKPEPGAKPTEDVDPDLPTMHQVYMGRRWGRYRRNEPLPTLPRTTPPKTPSSSEKGKTQVSPLSAVKMEKTGSDLFSKFQWGSDDEEVLGDRRNPSNTTNKPTAASSVMPTSEPEQEIIITFEPDEISADSIFDASMFEPVTSTTTTSTTTTANPMVAIKAEKADEVYETPAKRQKRDNVTETTTTSAPRDVFSVDDLDDIPFDSLQKRLKDSNTAHMTTPTATTSQHTPSSRTAHTPTPPKIPETDASTSIHESSVVSSTEGSATTSTAQSVVPESSSTSSASNNAESDEESSIVVISRPMKKTGSSFMEASEDSTEKKSKSSEPKRVSEPVDDDIVVTKPPTSLSQKPAPEDVATTSSLSSQVQKKPRPEMDDDVVVCTATASTPKPPPVVEAPSSPEQNKKRKSHGYPSSPPTTVGDDYSTDEDQPVTVTPPRPGSAVHRTPSSSSEKSRTSSDLFGEHNPHSAPELEAERAALAQKVALQTRHAQTVNDEMIEECKKMISCFGVPYITSPMEAEAQCAALNIAGLVDGVVTDDSDVFLFGANIVYRHVFSQKEHVESYLASDVRNVVGLDRGGLIQLAQLVGSDYAVGIKGIGPISAIEILQEFGDLETFRQWLESLDEPEPSEKSGHSDPSPIKTKLKRMRGTIDLPADFPSEAVRKAYLNPDVDPSDEKFSWSVPDLDELREYALTKFGWDQAKIDPHILPIIKKMNEKKSNQTKIDSFFNFTGRDAKIVPKHKSKRLNNAVLKLTGKALEDMEENNNNNTATKEKKKRAPAKPKAKAPSKRKKAAKEIVVDSDEEAKSENEGEPQEEEAPPQPKKRKTRAKK